MGTFEEYLPTTQAAIAAAVPVAKINRMIDKRILPKMFYRRSQNRTIRKDACLWIAFYFETELVLTAEARTKVMRDAVADNDSWAQLRHSTFNPSRAVSVRISPIWEDVDRRLLQLRDALAMVVEDRYILSGTPVFRGTRIPVYDVASLVDAGTSTEELRELYPRLKASQFELASIYAKANPKKGRPRRRKLPKALALRRK